PTCQSREGYPCCRALAAVTELLRDEGLEQEQETRGLRPLRVLAGADRGHHRTFAREASDGALHKVPDIGDGGRAVKTVLCPRSMALVLPRCAEQSAQELRYGIISLDAALGLHHNEIRRHSLAVEPHRGQGPVHRPPELAPAQHCRERYLCV